MRTATHVRAYRWVTGLAIRHAVRYATESVDPSVLPAWANGTIVPFDRNGYKIAATERADIEVGLIRTDR